MKNKMIATTLFSLLCGFTAEAIEPQESDLRNKVSALKEQLQVQHNLGKGLQGISPELRQKIDDFKTQHAQGEIPLRGLDGKSKGPAQILMEAIDRANDGAAAQEFLNYLEKEKGQVIDPARAESVRKILQEKLPELLEILKKKRLEKPATSLEK